MSNFYSLIEIGIVIFKTIYSLYSMYHRVCVESRKQLSSATLYDPGIELRLLGPRTRASTYWAISMDKIPYTTDLLDPGRRGVRNAF